MERVKNNEKWSLFCPNMCPGLENEYGESFNKLYCKYEKDNKYVKQARKTYGFHFNFTN